MTLSIDARVHYFKVVVWLAFMAGIVLSHPLWVSSNRFFPLIRPIESMPAIDYTANIVLMIVFIVSGSLWICLKHKRNAGFAALISLMIVLLQDQMRWQPWVYLYILLWLPYLFQSGKVDAAKRILNTLQAVMAGVYIWSGIHKLNPNFIDITFVRMMQAVGVNTITAGFKNMGYIIPVIEMAIGVGLLTSRFKAVAMYAAIAMHAFILLYLGLMMDRHNTIVFPWNIAMMLCMLLLFAGDKKDTSFSFMLIRKHVPNVLLLIVVWLVPILNLFGYWDHFLSFSFYSNKPAEYYIAIEESRLDKIDKRLQQYYVEIPGLQGGRVISVDKWSMSELNVPFYPQKETFKKLTKTFCALGIEQDKMAFIEMTHSEGKQQFNTFTCE